MTGGTEAEKDWLINVKILSKFRHYRYFEFQSFVTANGSDCGRLEGEPVRPFSIQSTRLQLLVYSVGGVSYPTADRQLVVDNATAERAGPDGDVSRLCTERHLQLVPAVFSR